MEFYPSLDRIPEGTIIVPQAPILALLGDIGLSFSDELRYFLHQQADRFEHVLFLAGNHEFYNRLGCGGGVDDDDDDRPRTVSEQRTWLRQVCQERSNLHFMEKTRVNIGSVRILGTTLWSHVPESMDHKAEQYLNDYHLSYVAEGESPIGVRKMRVDDTNQWHRESVSWLEDEMDHAERDGVPVVVLTHHTPSLVGTSDPKYDGNELSHCFSTNLTRLLQKPVMRAWACGHTHYNFYIEIKDDNTTTTTTTRLLSNQRGYPGHKALTSYDPKGYILDLSSSLAVPPSPPE